MEEVTPFHAALAANRDRYNARFRLAKHRSKNLDAAEFLAHLKDFVGPIVDAAAAQGGDAVAVTDALVDLSFATHGRMPTQLKPLLLGLPQFVAMDPGRVCVAMANALHHLESEPEANHILFGAVMRTIAPRVTSLETLLDCGAVLAWRYGLAALRTAALKAASRVPADLLEVIMGSNEVYDIDTLKADRWVSKSSRSSLRPVRRLGKFRGFGGSFVRPPKVFLSGGHLHATDGQDTWRVYVDRFGGALRRADGVERENWQPTLTLSTSGIVRSGQQTLEIPELAGASSWVSFGNTLAATTALTHAIIFVAQS